MKSVFRLFSALIQKIVWIFLFYRVKIERKFDCSMAHWRFSTNPLCVSYICNVPQECRINLCGAFLCSALLPQTYIKTVIVPPCEAHRKFAELPERNIRLSHLWLINFYILTIWLAEDIQFGRFFKPPVWPAAVKFLLIFTFSIFFPFRPFCTEAQKNLKQLLVY